MTGFAVRIAKVGSYSDEEHLRQCVRGFLGESRELLRPLLAAGASGLAVVKPNWVQEGHERAPDVWEPVISHPSVVMCVVEELARRMGWRGTICICDAPHTYANFDAIVSRGDLRNRLVELQNQWPSMNFELLDLRREVWARNDGVVVERRSNTEDPRGYYRFDLAEDSLFFGHAGEGRYYGADYDRNPVNRHHRGVLHEYLLAGTPIQCHLFVNIPKLKTHKKTGITCSLKNLVGINGDKNWLPHHTEGCPRNSGDEFPDSKLAHRIERSLKKVGHRVARSLPVAGPWAYRQMRNAGRRVFGGSDAVVRNGNWYGNDTCWRMVLDLNRVLLYGGPDGSGLRANATKPCLIIVDGIIGGEGDGPLCPEPVRSGVLLLGSDPALVDAVGAKVMGFNPQDLPLVRHAFDEHRWPITTDSLDEITVWDERCGESVKIAEIPPAVEGGFRPHFAWAERGNQSDW